MPSIDRRAFLKAAAATGAVAGFSSLAGCATTPASSGRVVVLGGGFGGATAAKYIRMWAPTIDVTLVERNEAFVSCPFSNRVLAGSMKLEDITVGYGKLGPNHGVKVVHDEATAVDTAKQAVILARGTTLPYDRLILAPGVDFMYETIAGLASAEAQQRVRHAWKAGPETAALRAQLEAMPDGGVFAVVIPKAPYRCPPGPYERACQVAHYFRMAKPRSKVLILDGNPDVQSKKGLFMAAWNGQYKGMIEYRPNHELQEVDARTGTAVFIGDKVRADVLNVIPPQKAGEIARRAGVVNVNNRWCDVDWLTMESKAAKNVHVIGDATQSAPGMPKSGHMANQHGKIAADAVIALMTGRAVNDEPMIANTCYSWINDREVVHVASVHAYDKGQKTMVAVKGAGGLSPAASVKEGAYARAWADAIWYDLLG
jgi:NADPH-dependent 2,4-dienoyl-CoA reductase/sulfur reductase-like enzyme